jgi:ParB family chromosome partitioning protein
MEEYHYTQAKLADSLGKSRSHIANMLRLNSLPDIIKDMVNEGKMTMGHARCLIGIEDSEIVAQKIIDNDLNVRQTEDFLRKRNLTKQKQKKPPALEEGGESNDDFILLGQSLSEKLGIKVTVDNSWNGGRVVFYYSNLEELDTILTRIN